MEQTHVGPCRLLEWDTDFWGIRIAQANSHLLTAESACGIDTWCREREIACLYYLARSDDAQSVRVAEDGRFRLVDIRVTLRYRESGSDGRRPEPVVRATRLARAEDLPALRHIAKDSYHDSRFYFDENFPRRKCDELYETWIRRSYQGYADAVLVVEGESTPAGFVTCHLDAARGVGSIGLVGVSEAVQRQGIGQIAVRQALQWFADREISDVEVVTQGRNRAAQRVYQRCGFVTDLTQLWYHKWYIESESTHG